MYSIELKREIIEQMRKIKDLNKISNDTGIPISTLYEWKKELKLRNKINELIIQKDNEEAKKLIERLSGEDNEAIRLTFLIRIARAEGDIKREKELLERQLQLEPNNEKTLIGLVQIVKKEGDKEKEREYLERILDVNPNNLIAIMDLIKILGEEIIKDESFSERILRIDTYNEGIFGKLINSIKYGKNQEVVKLLVRRLELEPSNESVRKILRKTAKLKEYKDVKKELLEKIFQLYPDDIKVLKNLAVISKEEGNIEREKELLERILQLETDQSDTLFEIIELIKIAIKEGDIEQEKKLLEKILQINPNDKRAICSLVAVARVEQRMARENGKLDDLKQAIASEKELLERILQIDPNNVIAIRDLMRVAIKEGDKEKERELKARILELSQNKTEKNEKKRENKSDNSKMVDENSRVVIEVKMLNRMQESKATPISGARKLIHESQDIVGDAEEIQRLLEGESETDRTIVLAELYYQTGLVNRANKLLKAYKRTLDPATSLEDIKAINQVMQIVQSKRQVGFEWDEFWDRRESSKASEDKNKGLANQTQFSTDSEER